MGSSSLCLALLIFLFSALFITNPVTCDDDETDLLFQDLNGYRLSLNLTQLTKNDNADCLADEIADQFKGQPCTNSTGANTVPGTEPQFPNYPNILTKCHLNATDMTDGNILPACVPNLDRAAVLANYTKGLYSQNLNDSKYTRVGIGSEGNWIVVVLATESTDDNSPQPDNSASVTSKVGRILHLLSLLLLLLH